MLGICRYYFIIIVSPDPDAHKKIEKLLSTLSVLASEVAPMDPFDYHYSMIIKVRDVKHLNETKKNIKTKIPNSEYDTEHFKGHISSKTKAIFFNGLRFFVYTFIAALITAIVSVVMTKFPNPTNYDYLYAFVAALVVALGAVGIIFQKKAESIGKLLEEN